MRGRMRRGGGGRGKERIRMPVVYIDNIFYFVFQLLPSEYCKGCCWPTFKGDIPCRGLLFSIAVVVAVRWSGWRVSIWYNCISLGTWKRKNKNKKWVKKEKRKRKRGKEKNVYVVDMCGGGVEKRQKKFNRKKVSSF